VWNRKTGRPSTRIVWQDREASRLRAVARAGHAGLIQQRTGLLVDSYFSATRSSGFSTTSPARATRRGAASWPSHVDSWLLWQLTGGKLHATDVSNASRTMLFDIHRNAWDAELLALLEVPASMLPQVLPSSAQYGATDAALLGAPIAIGGVAGDQQSALFGQACFRAGMAKNTYGTGCFLLMHTGERSDLGQRAAHHQRRANRRHARVRAGGQRVRRRCRRAMAARRLNAIKGSGEVQGLAESVPDSAA